MVSRLHTVMPAASRRGRCTRSASSPTGTKASAYSTCMHHHHVLDLGMQVSSTHVPPHTSYYCQDVGLFAVRRERLGNDVRVISMANARAMASLYPHLC